MTPTLRDMLRRRDALSVIGVYVPLSVVDASSTDRRPLLEALVSNADTLKALGITMRGEVTEPNRLPPRHCTVCEVALPLVIKDGFGVTSPATFPRCSKHAF